MFKRNLSEYGDSGEPDLDEYLHSSTKIWIFLDIVV
jgi:hypothetical protein